MKDIRSNITCNYIGLDIVKDLITKNNLIYKNNNINFVCSDSLSYMKRLNDKEIDLILCRHTCEHLPTSYNIEFIKEAKRVSKFLLVTTHKLTTQNTEINDTLYRPINLEISPYSEYLNNLIISLYDGPSNKHLPEMYINLYKF